MKKSFFLKSLFLLFILFLTKASFAQDAGNDVGVRGKGKYSKGFHFGLFCGALFANSYSAGLYDGYGLNADGYKNDFANSHMAEKILNEYGGGNGLPDRIAPALNCNHADWAFDQTDMPINMRYNAAIMVGLNMNYQVTPNDAFILNVNGSKLTANGDFTIQVNDPTVGVGSPPLLRTFPIIGGEQRLVFNLGYQRIFGEASQFNFFMEGGLTCTMTKFMTNTININGLIIDLNTYYDTRGYVYYQQKNLTGIGWGAFAGLGFNINISPKWQVQLVYDPSYEKVNIGVDAKNTFQHTAGLRAYYKLKGKAAIADQH